MDALPARRRSGLLVARTGWSNRAACSQNNGGGPGRKLLIALWRSVIPGQITQRALRCAFRQHSVERALRRHAERTATFPRIARLLSVRSAARIAPTRQRGSRSMNRITSDLRSPPLYSYRAVYGNTVNLKSMLSYIEPYCCSLAHETTSSTSQSTDDWAPGTGCRKKRGRSTPSNQRQNDSRCQTEAECYCAARRLAGRVNKA
jgi:hypothetical protein